MRGTMLPMNVGLDEFTILMICSIVLTYDSYKTNRVYEIYIYDTVRILLAR